MRGSGQTLAAEGILYGDLVQRKTESVWADPSWWPDKIDTDLIGLDERYENRFAPQPADGSDAAWSGSGNSWMVNTSSLPQSLIQGYTGPHNEKEALSKFAAQRLMLQRLNTLVKLADIDMRTDSRRCVILGCDKRDRYILRIGVDPKAVDHSEDDLVSHEGRLWAEQLHSTQVFATVELSVLKSHGSDVLQQAQWRWLQTTDTRTDTEYQQLILLSADDRLLASVNAL